MKQIVVWIDEVIQNWEDDAVLERIQGEVRDLALKFPLYPDLSY